MIRAGCAEPERSSHCSGLSGTKRSGSLLVAAGLVLLLGFALHTSLIVLESGGRVRLIPVLGGFSIVYVHSSEMQPWVSAFEISSDSAIVLKTIRVRSLGAGVPHDAEPGWRFRLENGWLVYDDIDKAYDSLAFAVSKVSPHYLVANGLEYNLVELFGDSAVVRVTARKRLWTR